ncbi:helix-turn-helix domain-containing protein [Actinoallomurus sp. NPDC050550]|uniref:helix-turn-helix domain-containing protein n=1 Tax=Actinoallomurus sp. NPDC050550 TaxID=3154937 RepID=UPI0034014578
MIKTVFHSDDLPPQDRMAAFDEFQLNSVHPMRFLSSESANFHAIARALDLADINVVELTCSPSEVRRTPRLIRECDPDLYSVLFPLHGRLVVSQAGREAMLGTRDLALYDSRHPFQVRIAGEGGTASLVRAQVPRALLSLPRRRLDSILAVPFSGQDGVGALLTQFLTRLIADSASYRAMDVPRLSGVAVDLMTASIAHHLDAGAATPEDSGQDALFLRIEAFVQRHLRDPELTPRSIASAHHISVAYLHRLFQQHSTTVSAWIRRQRLERARRDLADPALRLTPVHQIAARWGFNDHSTFTRAFRAVYDLPPRDYRFHMLTPSGAATE